MGVGSSPQNGVGPGPQNGARLVRKTVEGLARKTVEDIARKTLEDFKQISIKSDKLLINQYTNLSLTFLFKFVLLDVLDNKKYTTVEKLCNA